MAKEISIILVGNDRELRNVLDEARKVKTVPIRFEMATLDDLKTLLGRLHPDLIIYGMNGNTDVVGKTAQAIASEFANTRWAVMGKQNDVATVVEFFRMGALDFLTDPVKPEEMKRLIQKVVDLENRQETNGDQKHHLIGFFSSKGGVGTSLLSVNTAVELAQKNVGKVLLLDLVLQHGNVTDLLDISTKYTVTDLVENFDRLDTNLLENSIAKHPSGLYVLPCPRQPEDEDFLSPAQASEVFGFLKSAFHYVIADVGHEFSKVAISYLDLADYIFLVSTPDVPSLVNTRNAMGVFNKLSYSQEKTKVILNRWKMKGEIDFGLVQKNFPMEVFHRVQDDVMTCLTAANQGKALGSISKKSETTKSIEKLATAIIKLTGKEILNVAKRKV